MKIEYACDMLQQLGRIGSMGKNGTSIFFSYGRGPAKFKDQLGAI